jgi:hypothetical protein
LRLAPCGHWRFRQLTPGPGSVEGRKSRAALLRVSRSRGLDCASTFELLGAASLPRHQRGSRGRIVPSSGAGLRSVSTGLVRAAATSCCSSKAPDWIQDRPSCRSMLWASRWKARQPQQRSVVPMPRVGLVLGRERYAKVG